MNQKDTASLYEELLAQNAGDRNQAFMYHGVAYYNYNTIILHRQVVEQAIKRKEEETLVEIQKIITELAKISLDSVKIAEFSRVLVEDNPKLAETIAFIIDVELQEKHRRENAD